jgi:hypothetical protein
MLVGAVVEVLCFLIIQLQAQSQSSRTLEGERVGGRGNTSLAPSAHRPSEGFRNSINNSSYLRNITAIAFTKNIPPH